MSLTDPQTRPEGGASEGLATHLARIAGELAAATDEAELTQIGCKRSLEIVPADFCGITTRRRRGRLDSVAVTDDLARRCDALQYELGEGPCVDAALDAQEHVVHDTALDDRWPRWGPRVAALGVRSLVSVQLPSVGLAERHEPLGALNLYAGAPGRFGAREAEVAKTYAVHLAAAWAAARRSRTFAEAAESRHVIGIAQGVLMATLDLTADAAFEVLQRVSSSENVKLRDLARRVADAGRLPGTGA
ncbi:GAF and ANTAR domain-containing protein [Nocardioides zeae]|uniref:GAF and ANTAR domain-containing protein n=1 Tax=Nocardioides imazamoxiresistens TaxID=3231893 RepID=A0ABU3PQF6_9ACTN|nr:GAF and ANTAR domain-containing protein [Nocardioides zeae]MDT9591433.1 GAF and ANTAR domain-containing protein [Nocardioides zeae]